MEEREKVVRHMWDVYTHSQRIQIPHFWQMAFEAAYEDLASGEPAVREAAVSEIAKMSVRIVDLEPPPTVSGFLQKNICCVFIVIERPFTSGFIPWNIPQYPAWQ